MLWPESGWEPVSLTDLITSGSVKKVYRKATLCIHPDKVQQKGASLEQKYTAEKVFDILKVPLSMYQIPNRTKVFISTLYEVLVISLFCLSNILMIG